MLRRTASAALGRHCATPWLLPLALLGCWSCQFKNSFDYDWERFRQSVADIRAGKSHELHFYDTHDTDGLLKSVAGLPGITRVSFEHSDVTAAGFAAVATLPELEEVHFYDTWNHDDRWLEALAASQTLEAIRVEDSLRPHFFSVPKLLALPNLRKLRLIVVVPVGSDYDGIPAQRWASSALRDLEQATGLEELELGGPFEQEPERLLELQEKLPGCKISVVQWQGHEYVLKPVSELSAQ